MFSVYTTLKEFKNVTINLRFTRNKRQSTKLTKRAEREQVLASEQLKRNYRLYLHTVLLSSEFT